MKSRQFIAKVAMFTLAGTTVLGSGAALLANVNNAECVVYTKENPVGSKASAKTKCSTYTSTNTCKPSTSLKPGCGQVVDNNCGTGNSNNGNHCGNTGNNNNENHCGNTGNNNNGNHCGNTGNNNNGNHCGNTGNNNNGNHCGNTGNSNNGNNCGNIGNGNNGNTGDNIGNDNNGNTGDNTGNNNNGNTGGNTGNDNNGNNQGGNGSIEEKPETPDNGETSTQQSFENQVLVLVNKERANYGLNPLTMDESLRNVARIKSNDMSTNNYFDHTSPTYGSPFDMLKTFGIKYSAAAENIAQGYKTPEAVVEGWMNSPGHRANILNGTYTKIGVGYEPNGNYWAQLFTS